MHCVVTGATGFIGGAIIRDLVRSGHDVTGTARKPVLDQAPCPIVEAPLGDPDALAKAAEGAEVFVHAAGLADVRANPNTLGWTHIAGTENALAAAKHAGCARFVYISCANVTLIRGHRSFWNEDHTPTTPPVDAMSQTKLQAEELVRVSGHQRFRTVSLRPALVWGPEDPTHLPQWCAEAKQGGIKLVGGGKHLFATTYIDNLASAVLHAATAEVETGSVFYIADEELTLSKDFFSAIATAIRSAAPSNGLPRWLEWTRLRLGLSHYAPAELMLRSYSSAFDCSAARNQLGFRATSTQQEGFAAVARWVQQQGGLESVAEVAAQRRHDG